MRAPLVPVTLLATMLLLLLWVVMPGGFFPAWKHNVANVLVIKGFLADPASPTAGQRSLQQAVPLLQEAIREQGESTGAPTLARLGRTYLQLGNHAEAETWLVQAIARDPTDIRFVHWLIQAQLDGGKLDEAVHTLAALLRLEPLDEFAAATLDSMYAASSPFPASPPAPHPASLPETEPPAAGAESVSIAPGERYSVTLALPPVLPRWLMVTYNGEEDNREVESQLTVHAGNEPISPLKGSAGPARRHALFDYTDESVPVQLENRGENQLLLSGIWLEYMTNVEIFDDIVNANWTAIPYKPLPAGETYETYLRLPAEGPRSLVVNMFVFPGRYLDVAVDGTPLGRIDDSIGGGPTPFVFPIPAEASDVIKVTLHCPTISPPGGVALRYIYVQTDDQLAEDL